MRVLGPIDLGDVCAQILAIPPAVWERENQQKPNKFGTLDLTQHIVFTFVTRLDDWRESYARPLWSEWRARLEPLLRQATAAYGYANGAFPRIMLAKMSPGGIIQPHADASPSARWPHKIHIPIQTNDRVRFYVAGQEYHLQTGQAYEVNNMTLHAVRNDGAADRIHLIFEYYDKDQPDLSADLNGSSSSP